MSLYAGSSFGDLPLPSQNSLELGATNYSNGDSRDEVQQYHGSLSDFAAAFESGMPDFLLGGSVDVPAAIHFANLNAAAPFMAMPFDLMGSPDDLSQTATCIEPSLLDLRTNSLYDSLLLSEERSNTWATEADISLPSTSSAAGAIDNHSPPPTYDTDLTRFTTSKESIIFPATLDSLDLLEPLKEDLAWPSHQAPNEAEDGGAATPANPKRCPHPACASQLLFTRQGDLNKHSRLHQRKYICRMPTGEGCLVAFATAKDRNRHETGHAPSIACTLCGRLFSRQDNLRGHCRKLHA